MRAPSPATRTNPALPWWGAALCVVEGVAFWLLFNWMQATVGLLDYALSQSNGLYEVAFSLACLLYGLSLARGVKVFRLVLAAAIALGGTLALCCDMAGRVDAAGALVMIVALLLIEWRWLTPVLLTLAGVGSTVAAVAAMGGDFGEDACFKALAVAVPLLLLVECVVRCTLFLRRGSLFYLLPVLPRRLATSKK